MFSSNDRVHFENFQYSIDGGIRNLNRCVQALKDLEKLPYTKEVYIECQNLTIEINHWLSSIARDAQALALFAPKLKLMENEGGNK